MNIGKINKIDLNEKTAYLAGVIVGDGNISNHTKSKKDLSLDYRITIELIDKNYLYIITNLIKSIINTKSGVKTRLRKTKDKEHHYFQFRNKSFYYFLTRDLKIPSGHKCNSVKVPTKIFRSLNLQKHFLAGLFDTDGGIRSHTLGFTSASKKLMDDVSIVLNNMKIQHNKEFWLNKKYEKEYYGIRIKSKDNDKFLKVIPLKNKRKQEICFRHVDVPVTKIKDF